MKNFDSDFSKMGDYLNYIHYDTNAIDRDADNYTKDEVAAYYSLLDEINE